MKKLIKNSLLSVKIFIKKSISRKILIISVLVATSIISSSCSPYIWMAILGGLLEGTSNQTYNTSSPYSSGTPYYSTTPSTSSSSTSTSKSICSRCNGTGKCKSCGGAGRVYDYGSMTVITKDKYEHRCGVCNGSGKCGVCDGKGFY